MSVPGQTAWPPLAPTFQASAAAASLQMVSSMVAAAAVPVLPRAFMSAVAPTISGASTSSGGGFFSRLGASLTAASVGLSQHVADIAARGSSDVVQDMLFAPASDPVLRYHEAVQRLAGREFSVARAKRDSLAIVRLGNAARTAVPDLIDVGPWGDWRSRDPFATP